MGKKEHSKSDSKVFVLSFWKDGAIVNWGGKAVGGMDWGLEHEDQKFIFGEESLRCLLVPLKLLILLLLSYGQWMGNLSTNNLCKVIYLIASRSTFHSTLAWKIPWMEETGRLQSIGSLRVGHD